MRSCRILLCLILAAVVGSSVAVAQAADANGADAAVTIEPDVVYGHKDGLAMTLDVYRPAESNGAAILFMVSGGWYSQWAPPERFQPLFQAYLDEGYTMLAVRHGSSPRYGIPDAVADVRRAVRFVRRDADRWGIDPARLGVMGMSAGGHLSLMLGTTGDGGSRESGDELERVSSRVAAVVAMVPPTDLRVAVWEAPESLPAYRNFPALDLPLAEAEKQSPLVHVTADDAPALVIMGGKDDLVPPRHGEWIEEAFKREDVEHKLIIFPEAGHGLEGDENRSTLTREAVGWFDRHLLKKAG
jgi:acetyl esterase/lipase